MIKKTNGNLFRKTLGFFLKSNKYKLIFKLKKSKFGGVVAQTDPELLEKTGIISIDIDPVNSKDLSIIELASTILHESIHAELFRLVHANDPTVKPNERARIVQLAYFYRNSAWKDEVQHIHMTQRYVLPLAKALRELHGNKFSLDHYMSYAWEGLKEHASSDILPSPQKFKEWEEKRRIVEKLENRIICCQ